MARTTKRGAPIELTERERALIFAVAMRYVKDEERARDVTQDAMLLAYRHRDSFRGDARLSTWLYRIAATTSLMHLRKERAQPRCQSLSVGDGDDGDGVGDDGVAAGDEPRAPSPSPEEEWAATEAVHLLAERLAEMGEPYGRIFTMRFLEGYSETEIASALRLNVSTVKTRVYRARTRLKRELARALADGAAGC
jgi:RNA polymerase sigma-70 factor (ECF subfamily)